MRKVLISNNSICYFIAIIFIFVLNTENTIAQLSGEKTINSVGGDYPSFTSAVNALSTQGVNGPIIFKVANGTYNEQITIPEITGASAVNTITFQAASGDSSQVVLSFSSTVSTSNFTLRLNNSDHVILRKITVQALGNTYGKAIELAGTASNILIENTRLIGFNSTGGYAEHSLIYCYRAPVNQVSIKNNLFSGSNYGIYFEGVNISTLSAGTRIAGNNFSNQRQYGIYLENHNAPIVESNIIQLKSDAGYGIYLQHCENAMKVQSNKVILPGGHYGIYLSSCDGNSLSRGLIANNMISITGGGNASGIHFSASTYQNVWHNSVSISAVTSTDYGAFYLTGGSNIDVRNNIFANSGENYAYNIKTPAALEFSDYNNYYSNGNFLAFWISKREDIDQLKQVQSTLLDANSISYNPVFLSTTDLHGGSFRIDNKGTNLGLSQDIDGQTRTTYDIGADEFTGTGSALAAGNYTIGGTSPNYASFSQVANVLNSYGISGNVTFNVRNGNYNEQFTLGPIAGTGSLASVIFQAESGDSTKAELSFNSTVSNNYIVRFNGADYVTFRKLSFTALNPTYSRIFWYDGSSNYNSLLSSVLNGNASASSGDALVYANEGNVNNLTIKWNHFTAGRLGVSIIANSSYKATGTKINSNIFSSQTGAYSRAIYLEYHDAPEIQFNDITNTLGYYYYGIYLQYCTNEIKVIANRINSNSSEGGIYLYNCKSINTKRGLTSNNFVDIGGGGNAYGIYTFNCEYQDIYFNSVKITSANITGGRAFCNEGNSNNLNIRNNLLTNFGDGYALFSSGTTVNFASDYNDLYSTGNFPISWNGVNYSSLALYKSAVSPLDANSISINPVFLSSTDLHVRSSFLDNSGTSLAAVTSDIDGEPRSAATPDIGADEFVSLLTPLSAGTYTIGGSSPNYSSFSLAVNDLNTRGISGPVVFNVRDGDYNEQLYFYDINGSSSVNTIVFQSESNDSSKVNLSYSANSGSPYILLLSGTDNISFKKMTFAALNPSYSIVFYLKGGIQKLSIQSCQLNGNGATGSEYNTSVFYSGNGVFTDLLIDKCLLSGGRSGFWMESLPNSLSKGTRILNSEFIGQNYNSIYLKYHDSPLIENNIINNTTSYNSFKGIDIEYCPNDLKISGNYLTLPGGGTGIFLSYCLANVSKSGLISNNKTDILGNYIAYGINIENSDYQRVYFNSVRITSSNISYGIAFYNTNGSNHDVKNNIFSNFGGGYAYYTNSTTAISTSDFNNLFTTGNFLAYWNGNSVDLNGFRTLSSRETNSISHNPIFSSTLNSGSSFLNNKATPLAVISKDIDGEARSLSTPDIGADEFTPALASPLSGTYTIGGASPSFATFNLAAAALNERGISGPVVFNVRNGNYNEQFTLYEVSGTSDINTILIQSESGDSTAVVLSFNALTAGSNYLINLIGTDHLTLKNLTIAGLNPTNSQLIILNGNVSKLNLQNNVLVVNNNASSSSVISVEGFTQNYISIKNNSFSGGGYGINMDALTSNPSIGFVCSENVFKNQRSFAIRIEDIDSPVITGNDITSNYYNFTGIYLYNCDNKLNISGNRIYSDNYSTGINLNYCNGTFVNQGLLSNNLVAIAGESYATGISISNSQYQNVVYNSVNISSTYAYANSKYAFYLTGGDNIIIRNNIFSSSSEGYAYYVNTPNSITISDFNDYYSVSNIAYWGGVKATLAALKSANGMDAASLSVNPFFASNADLRVKQALFHKAATPFLMVTKDFYGNLRDATKPDIGAVEFSCVKPTIDITTAASCFGDSTQILYSISNAFYGSNFSMDFDNDFNPDASFTDSNGSLKYLFPSAGEKTINLIVSQIAGCNDFTAKTINIQLSPVFEVISTGSYCGDDNGSASVNVTGGVGPFDYFWSNGSKTANASNLAKGNYSVTLRNQSNCISTKNFEIGDRIVLSALVLKASACGFANGSAMVSASGGVKPYKYVWSNGEVADTALKLSSGTHYISVSDSTGCTSQAMVNISTDASGPKIVLKTVNHNKCYGDTTGALDVTLTGGIKPYSILWSNGSTNEDLINLPSGIYDITVTDNTGCSGAATFGIEQPVFINVSTVVTDASCNGSDGKAVALVGGGSKPYKYNWSNVSNGPLAQNLSPGIYTLTVTDNNNCVVESPVIINSTGGPKVALNKLKGVSCSNSAIGSIDINISGGTPLYSYSWLPGGQTSQDIAGLTEGTYKVSVTDNAGCVGVNSFIVSKELPLSNPICLVTVDSITGKNLIVWEKLAQPDVHSYNIYRESSSKGIFQLIGNRLKNESSEFVDEIANPALRSWKYKISTVDNCGNESALSEAHKTIHLTQNLGLNKTVNLIWDRYEGFPVSTYRIIRYSKTGGRRLLSSIPGDLTSFTDDKVLLEEEVYYEIEVENPNGSCSSLKASTYNSSRSNRQSTTVKAIGIKLYEKLSNLEIYPNPATTEVIIKLSQPKLQKVGIDIINSKGQIIKNHLFTSNSDEFQTVIDVSNLNEGVFILRINTDNALTYSKLIIEPR